MVNVGHVHVCLQLLGASQPPLTALEVQSLGMAEGKLPRMCPGIVPHVLGCMQGYALVFPSSSG